MKKADLQVEAADVLSDVEDKRLRTLWCGNLSEKVTEEILYELFLNAGPLEKVTIPKDRETGQQKTFGFILFCHRESVIYAFLLLNYTPLYGKQVVLRQKETGIGKTWRAN